MSQQPSQPISKMEVVYTMPAMERVVVRRDLAFAGADGEPLAFDLYLPPEGGSEPRPVVVLVAGYPDPGMERILGCRFKEMGSTTSWARLLAASGLAAAAATNRRPAEDLEALLGHLRAQAAPLGLDPDRVGLWACSGNGPLALSKLMEGGRPWLRGLALCYAYTLDLDGASDVADAAATWRFVHPTAGRTIDDLQTGVPLLLVRAGQDQTPGLNVAVDRLLGAMVARDLPLSFLNLPGAPHAFDLVLHSPAARLAIRRVLSFLVENLARPDGD